MVYGLSLFFPKFLFDDDLNIFQNWQVRHFSLNNLFHFLRTSLTPIPYIFWQAISNILGHENPANYRFFNIFFHAINGILVFRLSRSVIGAWLKSDQTQITLFSTISAFIFLMHPVQVESIVWISSFRGVISLFFMLLALNMVLTKSQEFRLEKSKPLRATEILFFLFLFALGALSKPTLISVMGLLLLIPLSQFSQTKSLRENLNQFNYLTPLLISFMTLSLAIVLLHKGEVLTSEEAAFTLSQRLSLTTASLSTYIVNLIFPFNLNFDNQINPFVLNYLKETQEDLILKSLSPLVLMMTLSSLLIPKYKHYGFFSLMFFALISPHIGLIFHDFQNISTVADRYLYAAIIPFAWLTSALILKLKTIWDQRGKTRLIAPLLLILSLFLIGLNIKQLTFWKDPKLLLEKSQPHDSLQSPLLIALGQYYSAMGNFRLAKQYYRDSLQQDSYSEEGLYSFIEVNELIPIKKDTTLIADIIRRRGDRAPSPSLFLPFARTLFRDQDLPLARNYLNQAIANGIEPRMTQTLMQKVNNFQRSEVTLSYLRLADYFYVLGKYKKALEILKKAKAELGNNREFDKRIDQSKTQISKK